VQGVTDDTKRLLALGKPLTSALLYQLVQYGGMYQDFMRGDIKALRFKAMFAYNLARILRQRDEKVRQWADELMQDMNDPKAARRMPHVGLVATCVLFARRGEEKKE